MRSSLSTMAEQVPAPQAETGAYEVPISTQGTRIQEGPPTLYQTRQVRRRAWFARRAAAWRRRHAAERRRTWPSNELRSSAMCPDGHLSTDCQDGRRLSPSCPDGHHRTDKPPSRQIRFGWCPGGQPVANCPDGQTVSASCPDEHHLKDERPSGQCHFGWCPDGQRFTTCPDRHLSTSCPVGQLYAKRPDGQRWSTRCPDGQRWSASCPDGQVSASCPDGQRWLERCPDGHSSKTRPGGHLSMTCPVGHLSTICPDGHFSTYCPGGRCPGGHLRTDRRSRGHCPAGHCPSGRCPDEPASAGCPDEHGPSGRCPDRQASTSCPDGHCGHCPEWTDRMDIVRPSGRCPDRQACPDGHCPGGHCPDGHCPSGRCPDGQVPAGCPGGHCPGGHCPDGHCPSGRCPDGQVSTSCPDGRCPGGHCPGGHCPDGHCPSGRCPDGQVSTSCPDGRCPGGHCPGGQCPGGQRSSNRSDRHRPGRHCPDGHCPSGRCPDGQVSTACPDGHMLTTPDQASSLAGNSIGTLPPDWRDILLAEVGASNKDHGSESEATRTAPQQGAGHCQARAYHSARPDEAGTLTDHRQSYGTRPGVTDWADPIWPSVIIDIESLDDPLLDPTGRNYNTGTRSGVAAGIGSRGSTGSRRVPFDWVEPQDCTRAISGLDLDYGSLRTFCHDVDQSALIRSVTTETQGIFPSQKGGMKIHVGPPPSRPSVRSVGTQTDRLLSCPAQGLIELKDMLHVSENQLEFDVEAEYIAKRRQARALAPSTVITTSSVCNGPEPRTRDSRATFQQRDDLLVNGPQTSPAELNRRAESPSFRSMRFECEEPERVTQQKFQSLGWNIHGQRHREVDHGAPHDNVVGRAPVHRAWVARPDEINYNPPVEPRDRPVEPNLEKHGNVPRRSVPRSPALSLKMDASGSMLLDPPPGTVKQLDNEELVPPLIRAGAVGAYYSLEGKILNPPHHEPFSWKERDSGYTRCSPDSSSSDEEPDASSGQVSHPTAEWEVFLKKQNTLQLEESERILDMLHQFKTHASLCTPLPTEWLCWVVARIE